MFLKTFSEISDRRNTFMSDFSVCWWIFYSSQAIMENHGADEEIPCTQCINKMGVCDISPQNLFNLLGGTILCILDINLVNNISVVTNYTEVLMLNIEH